MKKTSLFAAFILFTLFLIPFGTLSVAQPNGYIGVEKDKEYEWRINLDKDGLDTYMHNIEGLIAEIGAKVSELNLSGLESLTIPEAMETIAHDMLSSLLPSGWDGFNISTLFHATVEHFVTEFNSTILSGKIPSDWKSMKYNTFVNNIIDGLNTTIPSGWEECPVPELIKLAVNEFNSSILFGLVPTGWEDFTLKEVFEHMIQETVPELRESFITYMMINQMIEMMLMDFPSEVVDYSIDDLLPMVLPSNVTDLNLTSLRESIWYFVNSTMPLGWELYNISTLIDYQVAAINDTLPPGYDDVNASTLLKWSIDEMMKNATSEVPPQPIPDGWENMTIQELFSTIIGEIEYQWTTIVLPQWESIKQTSEFADYFPDKIGLRLTVDQIGSEVEAYVGGPKASPIEMTPYISLDMENWMTLEDLISNLTGSVSIAEPEAYNINETYESYNPFDFLLNFSFTPYIVDPSTYSEGQLALLDQVAFTGGFIIATNYDWENITTDTTIETQGNPDAFEFSAEWNEYGLLKQASLKADGKTAVFIKLFEEIAEIPGYEMTIFIIVIPVAIVGLIYYIRKKNHYIN